MKMTVRIPRSSPPVESELLANYVIKRCREVTDPPPVLVALALAVVADEHDFYNRLKEVIASSSDAADILRMCHEVFVPVLGRFQDGCTSDCSDEKGEYPFPDERTCRQVLRHALHEGKKMLSEECYEFEKGFEVLAWAGLQCFGFRLCQFEAVRHACEGDPENLIRQGVKIIRAALVTPRKQK